MPKYVIQEDENFPLQVDREVKTICLKAGQTACYCSILERSLDKPPIQLKIYCPPIKVDHTNFAMGILKQTIKWYETKFPGSFTAKCYKIIALDGFVIGPIYYGNSHTLPIDSIIAGRSFTTDEQYQDILTTIAFGFFQNQGNPELIAEFIKELYLHQNVSASNSELHTMFNTILIELCDNNHLTYFDSIKSQILTICRAIINNKDLPERLKAELLHLPNKHEFITRHKHIDIMTVDKSFGVLQKFLANSLLEEWGQIYLTLSNRPRQEYTPTEHGIRKLKNLCLEYFILSNQADKIALCKNQLGSSHNLSNQIAALCAIFMYDFEGCYKLRKKSLEFVKSLFKNSNTYNKIYAVLAEKIVSNNLKLFHAPDGKGYYELLETILHFEETDSQLSLKLIDYFKIWPQLDPERGEHIKRCLRIICYTSAKNQEIAEQARQLLIIKHEHQIAPIVNRRISFKIQFY